MSGFYLFLTAKSLQQASVYSRSEEKKVIVTISVFPSFVVATLLIKLAL